MVRRKKEPQEYGGYQAEADARAAFGSMEFQEGGHSLMGRGHFGPGGHLGLKPGWFIGAGMILIILGLIACAYPLGLTLFSSFFLGVLMIIGGIVELVQGFAHNGHRLTLNRVTRWETIIMGACLLIAGALMTIEPVAGAVFVTAFLGALFIFGGISKLFWAAHHRHVPGWWSILLSAVITLALGVLIFITLPYSSLLFIGLVIAIELLMLGFSALFFGFSLRRMDRKAEI